MNAKEYDFLSAQLAQEAEGIQTQKRPGYTGGNQDVLKNFKLVAERVSTVCPHCKEAHQLTPEAVWSVYFLKHIDAILSIMNRPDLPVSEAAIGRFSDARNYGTLGYALQQERDTPIEKQAVTQAPEHVSTGVDWLEAFKRAREEAEHYLPKLPDAPPPAMRQFGPKAATVLQGDPSDETPTKLLKAILSDQAQTVTPPADNSDAPESGPALEFRGIPAVYQENYVSKFAYVLPATPAIVTCEEADDSSSPASDPNSDRVVLFHARRPDSLYPNTN